MAARRDDERTTYPCMAMPPALYRVHTPEDDAHAAVGGRRGGRLRAWLGRRRLAPAQRNHAAGQQRDA